MSSFGEADIQISSTLVGKARVLNVLAESVIFPRLGLTVGITLHDRPDRNPPAPIELRDAEGELRLSENGDALGSVQWAGVRRFVRSSNYGHESQLRFVCDLDHWRLEQIERRRMGGLPVLWLELWPILIAGGEHQDATISPIRCVVPRERWLEFYSRVDGGAFEIIEIMYPARDAERFGRAVGRVRDAHVRILEGEYDAAVAECRKVLEAVGHELERVDEEDSIRSVFTRFTDPRRAKEYGGLVSKLRQLTALAHHDLPGAPITYSRSEAQFVVRTTEAVIKLIGDLTRPLSS